LEGRSDDVSWPGVPSGCFERPSLDHVRVDPVQRDGLSGLELSEPLAALGLNLPVIFMTAHDDPRTHAAVDAARPVAYLQKPFEGRDLLDAVARAMSVW
jgi:FixJ family two-component response regulator